MKIGSAVAIFAVLTALSGCDTTDIMQQPEGSSIRDRPELHRPPDLDLKPVDDEAQDGPGEAIHIDDAVAGSGG